jgi:F-type H+-transporting ATPase subunit O
MLASRVAARSARVAAPRFQAVSSRGFAEAAKVDAKPPVPLFGVDGTYASALVRNRRMHGYHGKTKATGN